MNFFTNVGGGNPMVWINYVWVLVTLRFMFWLFLLLELFLRLYQLFFKTPLWLHFHDMGHVSYFDPFASCLGHHFFTMGGGEAVNTFFGIATMIIAVPTGVKVFNWLLTMYKRKDTL